MMVCMNEHVLAFLIALALAVVIEGVLQTYRLSAVQACHYFFSNLDSIRLSAVVYYCSVVYCTSRHLPFIGTGDFRCDC